MNIFWDTIIEPLVTKLKPKHIIEIGADTGKNTVNLLEYCKNNEAILYSIDPEPQFDVENLKQDNKDRFIFYKTLSLNVIHQLDNMDLVLIDGDHNWYTVYNELKLIEKRCQEREMPFPFIILHDIDWPYARRDLYYNPDNIPDAFRKPFQKKGIKPGTSELQDNGGLNPHLFNAIYENNFQNGVLTALEDFMKESMHRFEVIRLSGFYGLALVFSKEAAINNTEVISFIETLKVPELLQKHLEKLELVRIEEQITKDNYGLLHRESKLKIEEMQKINNEKDEQLEAEAEKIEAYKNEIKKQEAQIEEQKFFFNEEKKKLEAKFKKEQDKLFAEYKCIQEKLSTEQAECRRYANSARYRIGNIIVRAVSSPIDFLKLPYRLWKIFIEMLRKKKPEGIKSKTEQLNLKQEVPRELYNPSVSLISVEKARYTLQQIIEINRKRLGSIDFIAGNPLVSILIVNHNGLDNLKSLFSSFKSCVFYANYEIIIVDNASTDGSRQYLEEIKTEFKATVILNDENKSFSYANNQASRQSRGKYLLLLNNDITVTDGWLDEMLRVVTKEPDVGAVGAKLVYPKIPSGSINQGKSFLIQHAGIGFRDDVFNGSVFIRPYNMKNGTNVYALGEPLESTEKMLAVTAAALLVSKQAFDSVGGLDEGYEYGYEDVDLCLKLARKGYVNYYCPTALLFHYEFGTQSKNEKQDVVRRRTNNIELFRKKWGRSLQYTLKNHLNPRKIAIMVPAPCWDEAKHWGDYHFALALSKYFSRSEYQTEIRILPEWEKEFDGRYVLVLRGLSKYKPKPEHINIMWNISHPDKVKTEEYNLYDTVLVSSIKWAEVVKQTVTVPVHPLLQCTDPELFAISEETKKQFELLFVGNSRKVFRKIIKDLLPTNRELAVFGTHWKEFIEERYIRGEYIPNAQLAQMYRSSEILLNDHWDDMREKGFISNRLFDALAAGAFVISDNVEGLIETLEDSIVTYLDSEDLRLKIDYYISHPQEKEHKVQKGRHIVLTHHTFEQRAAAILKSFLSCEQSLDLTKNRDNSD